MKGLSAADMRAIRSHAKRGLAAGKKPGEAMREAIDKMIGETEMTLRGIRGESEPARDARMAPAGPALKTSTYD